jgi:hypothetical protein
MQSLSQVCCLAFNLKPCPGHSSTTPKKNLFTEFIMEALIGPYIVSGCSIVLTAICAAVLRIIKAKKDKKRDAAQQKMHADILSVAASVAEVAKTVKPVDHEGLDDKIHALFEALKASPATEIFDELVALITKKRGALLGGITFSSIEEFITKTDLITKHMADLIDQASVLKPQEK